MIDITWNVITFYFIFLTMEDSGDLKLLDYKHSSYIKFSRTLLYTGLEQLEGE